MLGCDTCVHGFGDETCKKCVDNNAYSPEENCYTCYWQESQWACGRCNESSMYSPMKALFCSWCKYKDESGDGEHCFGCNDTADSYVPSDAGGEVNSKQAHSNNADIAAVHRNTSDRQ